MSSEFVYKILFLFIFIFLLKVLLLENDYQYPENIAHIKHNNINQKIYSNNFVEYCKRTVNKIFRISKLDFLNALTFRILNYRLFNAHHIFGLYQYRIIHQLSDGTMIEPVKVFNEDLSSNQSATLFSTRYLQALLYSVSDAVRECRKNKSYQVSEKHSKVFEEVCNYSSLKCSLKNISKHFIYVVPMDVPTSYVGSEKPWLKHKWQKFYEQDLISRKINYHHVDFNDSSFFPTSTSDGFGY